MIGNVSSRCLKQSLKEFFTIVRSFPGEQPQDIKDYMKPLIPRKQDTIILHTGKHDLKSNKVPSDIIIVIVESAKNIESNWIWAVVSPVMSCANKCLFSNRLQNLIKGNFIRFIKKYKVWYFSKGNNIVIQNNDITLNKTRNKEDILSLFLQVQKTLRKKMHSLL